MLDFRIHTFLAVCQYMNYTKAAESLHLTQPAVSQHIHYLEQRYGTKLFIQKGKKIRLSPAGELLRSTVTTLKNDEHYMLAQMHHPNPGQLPLVFGVTMTIGEFVIASPLASYLKKHPDTDVRVIVENTLGLLDRLASGTISFALIEGYFEPKVYDFLPYCSDPFIAVCSAQHSFVREPHTLSDLLETRLLIREPGSGTRDILEKNLSVKNMHLSDFLHTAEVSSMHTIVELLKEDCGISFLYKTAVRQELSDGSLREIPLSDFHMEHHFTFLWNKHSIFSDNYRSLCLELANQQDTAPA